MEWYDEARELSKQVVAGMYDEIMEFGFLLPDKVRDEHLAKWVAMVQQNLYDTPSWRWFDFDFAANVMNGWEISQLCPWLHSLVVQSGDYSLSEFGALVVMLFFILGGKHARWHEWPNGDCEYDKAMKALLLATTMEIEPFVLEYMERNLGMS